MGPSSSKPNPGQGNENANETAGGTGVAAAANNDRADNGSDETTYKSTLSNYSEANFREMQHNCKAAL